MSDEDKTPNKWLMKRRHLYRHRHLYARSTIGTQTIPSGLRYGRLWYSDVRRATPSAKYRTEWSRTLKRHLPLRMYLLTYTNNNHTQNTQESNYFEGQPKPLRKSWFCDFFMSFSVTLIGFDLFDCFGAFSSLALLRTATLPLLVLRTNVFENNCNTMWGCCATSPLLIYF